MQHSCAIPQPFIEQMKAQIGDAETMLLLEAFDSVQPVSVRLNPAKGAIPLQNMEPVPWNGDGYYLSDRPSFTLDPLFHAGTYYVQEAGSQFIGYLLKDEKLDGCRILDMCAAPGGKTTIYSTLVGQSGLVLANEYVRNRAQILADNVRKWGMGNVVVTNNAPEHISAFEECFDVVAVDAPCSGEGMFRKDDEARSEWSVQNVAMCFERQKQILIHSWECLRPGGILLYSTCTLNNTEDEGIMKFLAEELCSDMAQEYSVDVPEEWGIEHLREGAVNGYRFWPHRVKSEGFFVCVLRKTEAKARAVVPKARKRLFSEIPAKSASKVLCWMENPQQWRLFGVSDTLYAYDRNQAEFIKCLCETLTAVYSGVCMGQVFKDALKPDWALALSVHLSRSVVRRVDLELDMALEYLRRHDVPSEMFDQGLNLVCYSGHALGFIKRIGNRCNNLYAPQLTIKNL